MFDRLFPSKIDNSYQGNVLALWILGLLALAKLFMGVNVSGLNPWIPSRWVLQNADSIPVDTYGPEAEQVVLFLFSAWGLALLVLSALGLLVLFRYRAMTPLMYLLLIVEQAGRKVLALVHPIERAANDSGLPSGGVINWAFTILLFVGLALSLAAPRPASAHRR
jgi:hypothetical protein